MKKVLLLSLLVLVVLFISTRANAQGSLYSSFGLGEMSYQPSAQAAGMGYAGLAVQNPRYISRINPASLTELQDTRISGDFSFKNFSGTSNEGSVSQAQVGFNGVGVAFPVQPLAISVGLYPISRVDYNQTQTGTLDTNTYTFNYKGVGSLNMVPISVGYEVNRYVSIGASVNVLFGAIQNTWTNVIQNTDFSNTSIDRTTHVSGVNFNFGLNLNAPEGLFSENDKLVLALVASTRGHMHANRQDVLNGSDGTDTVKALQTGTVMWPESYGGGLAYRFKEKFLIAADAYYQNGSAFQYFNDDVSYKNNALYLGFGVEYTPTQDMRASYWNRVSYRAGAYSHQSMIKLNGYAVTETGATAGVSLPVGFDDRSRLDLSLQYGVRGTTANNLIKESIVQFSASISAGELWFLKRKVE
jgi:hypothetical protein